MPRAPGKRKAGFETTVGKEIGRPRRTHGGLLQGLPLVGPVALTVELLEVAIREVDTTHSIDDLGDQPRVALTFRLIVGARV